MRKNKKRWKDLTTRERMLKILKRNGVSEELIDFLENKVNEEKTMQTENN